MYVVYEVHFFSSNSNFKNIYICTIKCWPLKHTFMLSFTALTLQHFCVQVLVSTPL